MIRGDQNGYTQSDKKYEEKRLNMINTIPIWLENIHRSNNHKKAF